MSEFIREDRKEIDYTISLDGEPLIDDLKGYDISIKDAVRYTSTLEYLVDIALEAGNPPQSNLNLLYSEKGGKGHLRTSPESSDTPFDDPISSEFKGSITVVAYEDLDPEDKGALRRSIVELLEETEENKGVNFPHPTELNYTWNEDTGNLDISVENIDC